MNEIIKQNIIQQLSEDPDLMIWFQKWLDANRHHCCHCNKDKVSDSFYYIESNRIYPDGRLPICKKCINKLYFEFEDKYNGDPYRAMQKICSLFDIYYDARLLHTVIDDDVVVGRYLQRLNLRQNKKKLKLGYDGSHFDKE